MSISPPATSPETSSTGSLLHRYVRGDAAAFRDLTRRYYPLVFAAALRRSGGQHALAEDAAQIVFIDLAKRAPGLRADERLGGWLHQRALRAARDLMRGEQRRRERETAAAFADPETFSLNAPSAPDKEHEAWKDLAPFVDEALQRLSGRDRDAVLLRCVEGRDFRAVGRALGLSDDAAQKRVSRALEKLRVLLARRGVVPAAAAAALGSGLLADASAAATLPALSGKATLAASAALTKAGAISTAARWLPQLKAAAAGSALACAAWAWPLAKEYRAGNLAAAASRAAASSPPGGTLATGLHYPVFPAPPRREPGLSVEEIVKRIGALAAGPYNERAADSFSFFYRQLMEGGTADKALKLLTVEFSADLIDAMDHRGWREQLITLWARTEPYPALDFTVVHFADQTEGNYPSTMLSIVYGILHETKTLDSAALSEWFGNSMVTSPALRPGRIRRQALQGVGRELLSMALEQKSRKALLALCEVENEERLGFFLTLLNSARDLEAVKLLMTVEPQLTSPKLRAELMRAVMPQYSDFDYEGAQHYVEGLADPAQRLEYAALVAAPPIRTSGMHTAPWPQEARKKQVDWWLRMAPAADHDKTAIRIAYSWSQLDPLWGDAWLERQVAPEVFVDALLKRFTNLADTLSLEKGEDYRFKHLEDLARRLRKLAPEKTEAAFATLRERFKKRQIAEKVKTILTP